MTGPVRPWLFRVARNLLIDAKPRRAGAALDGAGRRGPRRSGTDSGVEEILNRELVSARAPAPVGPRTRPYSWRPSTGGGTTGHGPPASSAYRTARPDHGLHYALDAMRKQLEKHDADRGVPE